MPAPFDGEVIAVNEALADAPELINQDPYGAGWLVELKPATWPAPGLLDAEAYLAVMTAQAEEAAQMSEHGSQQPKRAVSASCRAAASARPTAA